MRQINARVLGRGVKLELNGHEWEINHSSYADDAVFIPDSVESLQNVINVLEVYWTSKCIQKQGNDSLQK